MNILENAAYLLGGNPFEINTRMLKESIWDNSYDRDAPKWILNHWNSVFPEVEKPEDPAEAKRMAKEKVASLNEIFNHPMDYTLGCPNERERDAEGNEIGPRVYEMKLIRMFCLGIVRILFGELNYETEFVNPRKIEDFKKCLVVALVADRKAQMEARPGAAVTWPWTMNLNDKSFAQLKAECLPQYAEAKATLDDWGNTWRTNNPNAHRGAQEREAQAVEQNRASDGTIDDGIPQPDMSDPITIGGYKAKWIQNHLQAACWNKYTNKATNDDGCNWCLTMPHTKGHWVSYMRRYDYPTVYFLWKDNFKQLKREDFNVEPYSGQQPYNEWGKSLMCLMVQNEGGEWTFKQLTSRYNHYRGDGRGGFQSEANGFGDGFARNLQHACDIIGCTKEELKAALPVRPVPYNAEDTAEDLRQDTSVFGNDGDDNYNSESARATRTQIDSQLTTTNMSMRGLTDKFRGYTRKLGDGSIISVINPSNTYGRRIFLNGFPVTTDWYRSVEILGDNTPSAKHVYLKVKYRNNKWNIIDLNGFKYLPRDVESIDTHTDPYKFTVVSNRKSNIFDIRTRKFVYATSLVAYETTIQNAAGYYTKSNSDAVVIYAPNGDVVFNKRCYDYNFVDSNSLFIYKEHNDSQCTLIDLTKPDQVIASWIDSTSSVSTRNTTFSPIIRIAIPNQGTDELTVITYNQTSHKVVNTFNHVVYIIPTSLDADQYSFRDKMWPMITHNDDRSEFKLEFISQVNGTIINSITIDDIDHDCDADDFTYDNEGIFRLRYYTAEPDRTRKYIYTDHRGNKLPDPEEIGGTYLINVVTNPNEALMYNDDGVSLVRNGEVVWLIRDRASEEVRYNYASIKINNKHYYVKYTRGGDDMSFIKEDGSLSTSMPAVSRDGDNIGYLGNDIAIVAATKTRSVLIDLATCDRLLDRDILAILTPFNANGIAKVKLERVGTRFINLDGDIAKSAEDLVESARRKRAAKSAPVIAERKTRPSTLDFAAFLMG